MKRFLLGLCFCCVLVGSYVWASYSPTHVDDRIVTKVLEKLTVLEQKKWEAFVEKVVAKLAVIQTKKSDNPRIQYILGAIVSEYTSVVPTTTTSPSSDFGCSVAYSLPDAENIWYTDINSKGNVLIGYGDRVPCNGCERPTCECQDGQHFVQNRLVYKKGETIVWEKKNLDTPRNVSFFNDMPSYTYSTNAKAYLVWWAQERGPYDYIQDMQYNTGTNAIFFVAGINGKTFVTTTDGSYTSDTFDAINSLTISADGSHSMFVWFIGEVGDEMGEESVGDSYIVTNDETYGPYPWENGRWYQWFCNNIPYYVVGDTQGKEVLYFGDWTSKPADVINFYTFDAACTTPYYVAIPDFSNPWAAKNYLYAKDTVLKESSTNIHDVQLAPNGKDVYYAIYEGAYKLYKNGEKIDTRWRMQKLFIGTTNTIIYATALLDKGIVISKNGNDVFVSENNGDTWPHVDYLFVSPNEKRYAALVRDSDTRFIVDSKDVMQWNGLRYFAFSTDSTNYIAASEGNYSKSDNAHVYINGIQAMTYDIIMYPGFNTHNSDSISFSAQRADVREVVVCK